MKPIAIADRMPGAKDRDMHFRVWWALPGRNDPETGEHYDACWTLRDKPYDGTTEWLPADALPCPEWACEENTYHEAA